MFSALFAVEVDCVLELSRVLAIARRALKDAAGRLKPNVLRTRSHASTRSAFRAKHDRRLRLPAASFKARHHRFSVSLAAMRDRHDDDAQQVSSIS